MKRIVIITGLIIQCIFATYAFAQHAVIVSGLNYLYSAQNTDGSWGVADINIDTSFYSTATVVETLKFLKETNSQTYTNGIQWLNNFPVDNAGYIAWRILNFSGENIDLSDDLNLLIQWRYEDGGWGGFDEFTSSNYHTALVLQALKAVNYSDQNTISYALGYLLSTQNTDGGWAFRQAQGDETYDSNVYMTALVLQTLSQYKSTYDLNTPINNAAVYLLANQNADGGFGTNGEGVVNPAPTTTSSTVYGTALAFESLISSNAVGADKAANIQNALTYLSSTQLENGSWNDDPYSTALALRALSISASTTPQPTTGTIIGKVVDTSNGQPLTGVSIISGQLSATTTNTGDFSLSNIPQGNQTIAVSLAGYTTLSTTMVITAGAIHDLGAIALTPIPQAPTTGVIRGTVTEAANNQPLEGVTITVSGSYSASAITGADGSFMVNGVTPGAITITATKTGYYPVTSTGTINAGMNINYSPKLSTQPPAASTGTITGRVYDLTTQQPITGAMISLSGGPTATTNAQGTFLITDISPNTYAVTIAAAGYAGQTYQVMITAGVTTDFQTIFLMTAPQPTTGNLTGRVYDLTTQQPITGAVITLTGGPTATTNTQGTFFITNITPNTYSVSISAAGFIPQTAMVIITAGITTDIQTAFLTPAPQSTTVSGTVKDTATGNPIAGADITITGTPLTTKTAADGTYSLTGISAMIFDIQALAFGYEAAGYHMTTNGYNTYSVNFNLNATPLSNLQPGNINFSDQTPAQGDTITINAAILNTGYAQAASIAVSFFDGDPQSGGMQIGIEQTIPAIAPNSSANVSVPYDTTAKTGRHGIYVKVDPLDTVKEINETDNTSSAHLTVFLPPDLFVDSGQITYSPANPTVDTSLLIKAVVRNLGEKDAVNVPVRLYRGIYGNGGVEINTYITPLIRANSTETINATATGLTAGTNTFQLVADPDNIISEINEQNNAAVLTVTADSSKATDLSVYPAGMTFMIVGDSFIINALLNNSGSADIQTDVAFYNGNPASGGILMGKSSVTVPAFGNYTITATLPLPSGSPVIYVWADPDNVISESDEMNNIAFVEIGSKLFPDFVLMPGQLSYSPSNPTTKSKIRIEANIFNYGGASANAYAKLYDGDPATGGILLGSFQLSEVNPISAQSSMLAYINLTNVSPGEHVYYAVVDPDNSAKEINETNNKASIVVNVGTESTVDLFTRREDIEFIPEFPIAGENFKLRAVITNSGNEPTAYSVVAIYNGNPSSGGTRLGFASTSVDQQSRSYIEMTMTMQEGIPEMFLVVDWDNRIAEIDETNNIASRTIDTYRNDLSISTNDINLIPIIPNKEDTITVSVTVHSYGNLTKSGTLKLYETLSGSTRIIGSQNFTVSGNTTMPLDFPSYVFPGNGTTLTAVIENIAPSDEDPTNNEAISNYGERIADGASNEGREFWIAWPYIVDGIASIIIQSKYNANVTVTLPAFKGTTTWTGNVMPGFPARIRLTDVDNIRVWNYRTYNSPIEKKGIHIQSDKEVSVIFHAPVDSGVTDDTYLALPVSLLGTEYFSVNYTPFMTSKPCGYTIVAVEDNTSVMAGADLFTLNKGQTYHAASASDLTGTRIRSNKPVTVISSNADAFVPVTIPYSDVLMEQLLPVSLLGIDYFTAPLYSPYSSDIYRILATEDNTEVLVKFVHHFQTLLLNAGEWSEIESEDAMHIIGSKPVSVMQFAKGSGATGVGDPFQMMIVPTDKLSSEYRFYVHERYETGNFVTVVAPEPDTIVSLDGVTLNPVWTLLPDRGNYVMFPVGIGEHVFRADKPIGVYVHGYRPYGSYGYPAGVSVPTANLKTETLIVSPSSPSEGQLAEITSTITNTGDKTLQNIVVRAYNGDPADGGMQIVDDLSVEVFYPKETRTFDFTWDTFGYSGINNIYVIVDPLDQIRESDESDNTAMTTVTVTKALKPDPAIAESDMLLSQGVVNEGDTITVSALIKNRGADAGNIPVSLYLGDPENSGVLLDSRTINPIIPLHGEVVIVFSVNTLGFKDVNELYVVVDPQNLIQELDETNNTAFRQLMINKKKLALEVVTDKTQYQTNSDVGINVYINNEGMLTWSGTGDVYIEDAGNQKISHVTTFSIDDLKPLSMGGWHNRTLFTVTSPNDLNDAVADSAINFNQLFTALGIAGKTLDLNSLRVYEFDASGILLGEKNARFEKDSGFDLITNPSGHMLWHLDGITPAGSTRMFYLYFDTTDNGPKAPSEKNRLPQNGKLIVFTGYWGDIYSVKVNSDGTFGAAVPVDTVSLALFNGIKLADFNNDGFPDIISGDVRGDIFYHQNRADYSNTFIQKVKIGNLPYQFANNILEGIASGDFNHDNNQDFVVNTLASEMYTFLGNGNGTFTQNKITYYTNKYNYGKATADINNDGNADLVIGDNYGVVTMLFGDGKGEFGDPVQIENFNYIPIYGLAIGDMDNDGFTDIIANPSYDGVAYIMKGMAGGTFKAAEQVPSLKTATKAYYDIMDINEDEKLDVVATQYNPSEVFYFEGNGDGTFKTPVNIPTSATYATAVNASKTRINPEITATIGTPEKLESRLYNFIWNTGTTPAGSYKVHVTLSEGQYVVVEDYSSFDILPDAAITSKITTDKISYSPNQPVTITSTITSASPNYIFENLAARVTVASSQGQILFTDEKPIQILTPGQLTEFKTYWNTSKNPSGIYPVTLEVTDASGAVLSTSTANLTFSSNIKPSKLLKGTISVDKQSLLQGEPVNITYSVTNIGNIDLSQIDLSVLTIHVINLSVYDTLTDQTALQMGGTFTNMQQLNTDNYSAKDYLVILRANISGVEETLAGTYFRVEGAPSAPSLYLPTYNSDIETFLPALVVNNASDPNDDKLTYQFELYGDSGLANLLSLSGVITEGSGRTSWSVPVALQENAVYYWRARAYDGLLYGEWMSPASFRVNLTNEPPTAPSLSSPSDSASVDTAMPLLTVNNASDPDSVNLTYNFVVAFDPGFATVVASQVGVFEGTGMTSWKVATALQENTWYYWTAQADDWLTIGPWMTTAKFFVNTTNDAPTAPTIISPVNSSKVTTLYAAITASNSTDPDSANLTYIFEADATMTFDSADVMRTGNIPEGQGITSWSINGLKDNKYYYVRVKASDGLAESPWSDVVSFFVNTANDAPTVPVLSNPSNGSGVNVFTPALSVHNSTDIDGDVLSYEFEIYADAAMTNLIAQASGIGESPQITSWTVPVSLTENMTYYWRARAYDGELYSGWMPLAYFMVNTANDAPSAPALYSPAEGSSISTLNPTLSVYNAIDPDNDSLTYDFEIYSNGILIQSITGISQNISGITSAVLNTPLSDNTIYHWRARAYDGDRYGAWMDTASFSIHLPSNNITATIDFDPNTLNKKSKGNWVTVYIELPNGYKVTDIDISSVRLQGTIPAELWPYSIGDYDRDGIPDLMVKFKRNDVINLLPNGENITVHVKGTAGLTTFEGIDIIRVIP